MDIESVLLKLCTALNLSQAEQAISALSADEAKSALQQAISQQQNAVGYRCNLPDFIERVNMLQGMLTEYH